MGCSGWALGMCDCEDLKNISWHCTCFIWIAKLVIIFNSTSLLLHKIKSFVAHNIDPFITFASSNSSRWYQKESIEMVSKQNWHFEILSVEPGLCSCKRNLNNKSNTKY
jgi:hypothetical protein